ncbi:MAG: right-handed parallel beta-helix repeat-containing protein [Opitutaceae bacterium]|jgi:hypothetical protein|nr:right-handed parallel beta-helix repeat-containing protein [Opitutaceae bacterium]
MKHPSSSLLPLPPSGPVLFAPGMTLARAASLFTPFLAFAAFAATRLFSAAPAAPAEISGAGLNAQIAAIRADGGRRLVIKPGVYRITAPAHKPHWLIENLTDFEIVAAGVTLVGATPGTPVIHFTNCARVTLGGITLLRDPPPFSQGKITAISPRRDTLDVEVDAHYPTEFTSFNGKAPAGGKMPPFYVIDRGTRLWRPGTADVGAAALEQLGPRSFRIILQRPLAADYPLAAGDALAWRGRHGGELRVVNCEGMRFLDGVIANGSGFTVHENGGAGGNFYRYRVTFGPPPAPGAEPPLISCNADAFHSSNVRRGPTLEDCFFEGMPDDGVPIHGSYAMVLKADGAKVLVDAGSFSGSEGDRLSFYGVDGGLAGDAVIVSAVRGKPLPEEEYPKNNWRLFSDRASKQRTHEIVLDRALPLRPAFLVANRDTCGADFVVRRCTIRNHRARGMLLKADRGLVEDCLVEGSTMGGIVISPEPSFWAESDYTRGIIVRRNTVRRTGTWRHDSNPMAGALSLGAHLGGKYAPAGGHRDILIEDNVFEDNDGVNMVLASADGVVVKGNRFIRPMRRPASRGRTAGIPCDALVAVRNCENLTFEKNEILEPGPELKQNISRQ